MGSSKGSAQNQVWFGTFMGILGCGPALSLEYVIVGGNSLAYSGHITQPVGQDYVTVTLIDVGTMRFYFGTETQMPDSILNGYAPQPGYRGMVYIVMDKCLIGGYGASVPTIQVCWRRYPNQNIITNVNGSAQNDSAFSANPVVCTAELISSWDWLGLPTAQINTASAQATADSFQSETIVDGDGNTRAWSAQAPLVNEQSDLKAALADIASISQGWLRDGIDGTIEFGRWWRSGATITNVAALTWDDCEELPTFEATDFDKLPNSFVVEFTDSTLHHKGNCLTVDNTANQRAIQLVRRQTASRKMLLLAAQAKRHGADLLQQSAQPTLSFSAPIRRARAVKPDGTYIRPGDYITFPVSEPGETADIRLFRVMRRSFDPFGPVTLECDLEINTNIQATTNFPAANVVAPSTPPLYYYRMLSMAAATDALLPPVCALCARPVDMGYNVDVAYSNTSGGDYESIGTANFALPMSLTASVAASDSAITLTLLPQTAGLNPQRDASILTDWAGGVTAANADELVLILVKKSAGAVVLQSDGITPWVEFMSVSGAATVVGTNEYSVPVLRGRRSTKALAFNTGAFPDVWTDYEAWLIPLANLVPITHPDFPALIAAGGTGYFALTTFGQGGDYAPLEANTEYLRRTAAGIPLGEFALQTDNSTFHPVFGFTFSTDAMQPVYSQIFTLADVIQMTAFAYFESASAPSTPVGGSYNSAVPTTAGWTNDVPAASGNQTVWESSRTFTRTGVGQDATWSTPVVVTGIDPTVPGSLSQPSLASDGVYLASDGTVKAELTFNMPSTMPANASEIDLFFRVTGTSGWQNAGPVYSGGGTITISDLTPGTSYDVAAEAMSHDIVVGGKVSAIGSPFIAPAKTTLPTAPSGFAGYSPSSSWPCVQTFAAAGYQNYSCTFAWTPSTDVDYAGSEWQVEAIGTTPTGAGNPFIGAQLQYNTTSLTGANFWVRNKDRSGNFSAWTNSGLNPNAYVQIPAGTMSSQNQSGAAMTAIAVAPLGASSPSIVNALAPIPFVRSMTGGSPTETFSVSIAGLSLSSVPQVVHVDVLVPSSGYYAAYDFSNAGNSSSTIYVKCSALSGNIPSGFMRFAITVLA